ncbi:MAG: hypothetical protein ACXIVQ_12555 [Acidimicrobiales bacterium]
MKIDKLSSTSAFVATDLEDAPLSVGVVRAAPKVLQGGAQALARTATYTFALRELQVGGVSAGISADPDDRPAAAEAFVAELTPRVESGSLVLDVATGLDANALAVFATHDPRDAVRLELVDGLSLDRHLAALSPVLAAAATLGDLDGRTAAVESGPQSARLVRELTARGARIVAYGGAKGVAVATDGLDASAIAEGAAPDVLASDTAGPDALVATTADVLFCGSRQGMIDGEAAEVLSAKVLVPTGCQPLSAKGLAVLRRRGVVAVADFVATAGPTFAWWPVGDNAVDTVLADAEAGISDFVRASDHDEGPLLGACYRAEAFLGSWLTTLPFGRPIA